MLRNNKEREEWLYRQTGDEKNTILNDEVTGIIVKKVQINKNLFYNKIHIPAESFGERVSVCACNYCTNANGIRLYAFGSIPTSDSQVVNYLKDHRNDDFVKELSL